MRTFIFLLLSGAIFFSACDQKKGADTPAETSGTGLKIAYVNSDSVLNNFKDFKTQAEAMSAREQEAEANLQKKGAALEKEIIAYQQRAQKGTMTGKEMEAQEKYLAGKQETLLAERDQLARAIMEDKMKINDELQKTVIDILEDIKEEEGYDFILSYIDGGPILVADEKYAITDRVIKALNNKPIIDTYPDTTDN